MENIDIKDRISALLDSDIYKTKTVKMAELIRDKSKYAENETELSSLFENQLYYFIRTFFSVDVQFKKEVNNNILRHRFTGRMDVLCNNLVIEYKHFSKLATDQDKEKAVQQVIDYLEQLYTETDEKEYRAILTDGIKIKYFYYQDNTIRHNSFIDLDNENIDIIIRSLIAVEDKRFSPVNIVRDFQIAGVNSITRNLARNLFRSIDGDKMNDATENIFNEWKVLFHLSENDMGKSDDISKRRTALGKIFDIEIRDNSIDFKALFALQTTYAVIIKLIATKFLTKWKYQDQTMYFEDLNSTTIDDLNMLLKHIEDGYNFSEIGVQNLLEGDFFSWYLFEGQWDKEIGMSIKEIIKIVDGYSKLNFKNEFEPIDIFKDLYMEVMPNSVRHSLGEYFTPAWIADYVLHESINMANLEKWKVIDPCCGSGIFVITALRKIIDEYDLSLMSNEEKNRLLESLVIRVKGIDINPISVLTSRISYFLAISPLINDGTKLDLPIYIGDSAIPGNIVDIDGISCYSTILRTPDNNINITLPRAYVENGSFVSKMDFLNQYIRVANETEWTEKFVEFIGEDNINPTIMKEIESTTEALFNLRIKNEDNIWLKLITNQMKIASIKDIDIIIGNPPWVKWEHLPQLYAQSIAAQCVDRHLFSGQTYMGAISLNICALIANVTASKWLNDKGVLAFLMPKTLLTQDSYAGFRNFYVDYKNNQRMYLQKIDDWTKAGNPFIYTTEKFSTYYYQYKYIDYMKTGVPIKNITKKRGIKIEEINNYHNFIEVKKYYDVTPGVAFQLDEERTGFSIMVGDVSNNEFKNIVGYCHYKARSGVEFTPYEIYTLEAMENEYEKGYWKFKNFSSSMTRHKAIQASKTGTKLETKYIKPIVKGSNVEQFNINFTNEYGIFPYMHGETESIKLSKLTADSERLVKYLIGYKDIIEAQSQRSKMIAKGKDFYSLSKIGKYTYAPYLVAFRDNSKMAASVVMPVETHWGEKVMPVCAKHAPYISMDKDGNFISEEEAHYICAIFNSQLVQDYFKSTYSSRSYSINLNIKIPKYSDANQNHRNLWLLSKEAHSGVDIERFNSILNEINSNYIELIETEL